MKKYLAVMCAFLLSSVYAFPVRADSNGNQPETPASMKQPPVAGSAQTDMSGAPKLIVEFATAHANIPDSYSANIRAFGKYMVDHPQSLAAIAGYADHTGHGPANAVLAQSRADALKSYLVANCSVAVGRITAESYGEVSNQTRNNTEAGKQNSRSAIATIVQPKS